MNAIVFPKISPVAFSILGFYIYWYALAYIFGILLGVKLLIQLNEKNRIFSIKALEDIMFYVMIGILLGGRMGYIIFYDLADCLTDPLKILMFRKGGMSFHGGMLGVGLGFLMLGRKYIINYKSALDMVCCVAPIGLFLGRIANFVNGELYGRITDVSWGVRFSNGGPWPRHPSQLYEAFFEGVVLFTIMLTLYYKTVLMRKPGTLCGIFLIIYALMRTVIESFREPDIQLGFFFKAVTMGQILSLPMIVLGFYFIFCKPQSRRID